MAKQLAWIALWGVAGLLGSGCQQDPPADPLKRSQPEPKTPKATFDAAQLGVDRPATLAALGAPFHRWTKALGPHALSASSLLQTQVPGLKQKKVEQQLTLRVDEQGHFAANKTTHPQYGNEVIWDGQWLYARLRYSKFTRRKPRPREAQTIADRLYGLLPAYLELLGPFVTTQRQGMAQVLGRQAVRVTLSLNKEARPEPPPEASAGRAKAWRKTINVTALEGEALLDQATGAPLRVRLAGKWSFAAPAGDALPKSGIPAQLDAKRTGTMTLDFSQEIKKVGPVAPITAPAQDQVWQDLRRERLEIERQMLTGERPAQKGWAAEPETP